MINLDTCVTEMSDDSGIFQQNLLASIRSRVGDIESVELEVVISKHTQPNLLVTCKDEYGRLQVSCTWYIQAHCTSVYAQYFIANLYCSLFIILISCIVTKNISFIKIKRI